MIHIESDYSEIDRELDRLERMPDGKTRLLLDTVLQLGYKETQAAVHIETGSLRDSGKVDSEVNKIDQQWTGEISYGGPSSGPNNPVDYAIYEKARGVGGAGGPSDMKGDHDFMSPLKLMDPMWIAAIKAGMRG